MITLYFILVLLAVICFVVAAFLARPQPANAATRPMPSPVLFLGLGLALWALVPLLQFGQRL